MLIDFNALSLEALVPQRGKNNLGSLFASANLSPDKLLANRLCGQCHSYFDTQKWRPYDQVKDSSSDIPIIAHMEEVVFDVSRVFYAVCDGSTPSKGVIVIKGTS